MTYLKAICVGIVTGLFAAAGWLVVALLGPVAFEMSVARLRGDGVGAATGYVGSESVLIVGLAGFALGAIWNLRRTRRMTRRTSN